MAWRVRHAGHLPRPAASVIAFVWIVFLVVTLKALLGRQASHSGRR